MDEREIRLPQKRLHIEGRRLGERKNHIQAPLLYHCDRPLPFPPAPSRPLLLYWDLLADVLAQLASTALFLVCHPALGLREREGARGWGQSSPGDVARGHTVRLTAPSLP